MRTARKLLLMFHKTGSSVTWLFSALFQTDESAPMATPATADPGPGTYTVIDVEGDKCHIEDSAFIVDTLDTSGARRALIRTKDGISQSAGTLSFFSNVKWGPTGADTFVGNSLAAGVTGTNTITGCVQSVVGILDDSANSIRPAIASLSDGVNVYVVVGDNQQFVFANRQLLYVQNSKPHPSYNYPQYSSNFGGTPADPASVSAIAVVDLVANGKTNWEKSFARVTDSLSAPWTGTLFTMDADSGECTYGYTGEAGKNINVWLRHTDTDNRIYIYEVSDGSIFIVKKVGGTGTNLYVGSGLAGGTAVEFTATIKDDKLSVWRNQVKLVDEADVSDVPKIDACRCAHSLATNDIELTTHPLDPGVATSRSIYPQVGDTQSCDADVFLDLESVTLPSAGSITYDVRYVDDNNRLSVTINADGSITLDDVVSGVSTTRITGAAGTVANLDRVTLRVKYGDALLYSDNGYINSTSAIAHQAAGVGKVSDLGTAGAISASACYAIGQADNLVEAA